MSHMKSNGCTWWLAIVALMPALFMATPCAGQAPVALYWYDQGMRRPLYLDGTRIADFSARPGESVLRIAPARGVADPSERRAESGSISPVFTDQPGPGQRPRALPGGVLVTLKAPMDDAQAQTWFAARGLTVVRRIGSDSTWLVQSPPGLASLELANRLQEGADVVSARPNWWQARTLK